MAENFVQIRIKATDTAKPDLDELRANLDELGSKVDTAKVEIDDDEAKLKLLEINAQLAALNKRVANPKIDVSSAARAQSQVEKLGQDFDKLIHKVDESNSSSGGKGLFSRLLFGAGSVGQEGGGGGLAGLLPGGGMLVGLALLVPAIEAAAVEVTGLASGFAAAGAGAGAFAALALPAFHSVSGALTKISADQLAYHDALTKTAKSTALAKLKQDYANLDPAERGAVRGIQRLMDSYHQMARAFEPQAFKVFNDGLKIANELMPALKPFADTAATAFGGLLKQAAGFFRIKTPATELARGLGLVHDKTASILTPFGQWLKQFHSLEGPSIHAIGEGIGRVAVQIGHLLTVMSKKDVVHAINIAFDILADTIKTVIYIVSHLMKSWDQLSSAFRRVRHDIAADAHEIAHVFDDLRHDAADLAHNVGAHFDEIRHDAANLAHNIASYFDEARANIHRWAADVGRDTMTVVHYFQALPGRIMGALASLPGRLFAWGAHCVELIANGIRSAIGDVTSAIGSVVSEITSHLPFSPAKKGPLSGRGDPLLAGKRITQYLATGMESGIGTVSAAADRVAGATMTHGRLTGGAGGHLVLQVTGQGSGLDALFITWLRRAIRTRGGLQKALGP